MARKVFMVTYSDDEEQLPAIKGFYTSLRKAKAAAKQIATNALAEDEKLISKAVSNGSVVVWKYSIFPKDASQLELDEDISTATVWVEHREVQ